MDERGSVDKAQVISALQTSGDADYDSVRGPSSLSPDASLRWRGSKARETLKNVNIDSSGRVEMEDWVQLHSLLRAAKTNPV